MNISFINPAVLWALPLAAVPVVFHFFFRRRLPVVPFSDLRLLRLALARVQGRLKLRHYLLLLVRSLAVLLLVLFFARPVVHFGAAGAGEGGRGPSVVVLIDVSYSMGYRENGRTRLESMKEKARRIISLLPEDSRVGVIACSDRIEAATPALGGDRAHLERVIEEIRLSSRPTDLREAFRAAEGLFSRGGGSNRIIVLLSDLAAHAFREKYQWEAAGTKIVVFPSKGADNLWIADAVSRDDGAGDERVIESRVDWCGGQKSAKWPIHCFTGGAKAGSDLLDLRAGRPLKHRFPRRVPASGEGPAGPAYVELLDDALPEDNRRYVAPDDGEPLGLWIVDGDPRFGGATAESFYLKNAFPRAEVAAESDLPRLRFSVPGVVILANVREAHPAIEEFVRSGGGLIVFPGDHTGETFTPAYLPAAIGGRFEKPETVRWAGGERALGVRFPAGDFDWQKISVEKGFVLQAHSDARSLAVLSSGWPFLVEGGYGKGTVALFAAAADRDGNNLAARPLYAPFLQALARSVAGRPFPAAKRSLVCGETFRHAKRENPVIVTPSGERKRPAAVGDEIVFDGTEDPGIYALLANGSEAARFAVNLDAASGESDLTPAAGRLDGYFSGQRLIALRENWEKKFSSAVQGTEAGRALLAGVLFLALAEIVLANSASRRKKEGNA